MVLEEQSASEVFFSDSLAVDKGFTLWSRKWQVDVYESTAYLAVRDM